MQFYHIAATLMLMAFSTIDALPTATVPDVVQLSTDGNSGIDLLKRSGSLNWTPCDPAQYPGQTQFCGDHVVVSAWATSLSVVDLDRNRIDKNL